MSGFFLLVFFSLGIYRNVMVFFTFEPNAVGSLNWQYCIHICIKHYI